MENVDVSAIRTDTRPLTSAGASDAEDGQTMMDRVFFLLGAVSAFMGVTAGAFGAHSLKGGIRAEMLAIFEVGVRYQIYHALGLFAASWGFQKWPSSIMAAGGWCFVIGTVLFSGSLYLMSLFGARWIGVITPLGGLAFLAGWICLGWAAWKART